MALEHDEVDAAAVRQQMQREMRGRWAVARRCHLGVPMVIESHPRLDDGAPFPTLYWLTCPVLVKRVSRLEAAGRMTEINERLARDGVWKARLGAAIAKLRQRRDSHEVIEDSGAPPGGGPDKVKCLHAHVAQELALPPNPVGALAMQETGWPDCVASCVNVGPST